MRQTHSGRSYQSLCNACQCWHVCRSLTPGRRASSGPLAAGYCASQSATSIKHCQVGRGAPAAASEQCQACYQCKHVRTHTHVDTEVHRGLLFCFVFFSQPNTHSITIKIHCINRVAPSLRVRRVLPWQQWREEAAVAGAPERQSAGLEMRQKSVWCREN